MGALIEIVLPVFLVIATGYVSVWRGFFTQSATDALMKFSQNIAIPLLLFRAISTLDLSAGYDARLLVSYYTGSLAGFVLGLTGARFIFARSWPESVAIGFAALFANTVLLGLPITERAYGVGALAANYVIISIHTPFCYVLGITTMEAVQSSGKGLVATLAAILRAILRNVLMMAILAGFLANFAGLSLPAPVASAFDLLIRAALPTALFALGGVLCHYRPDGDLRVVFWVCSISLFVHPTIAFLMTTQVFGLSHDMVRSAVLTAAMAPGINAYIFANLYGSARRVAAASVLVGTFFSVLSVSFWLFVLGF